MRWATPEREKHRLVTAAGHGAQIGTGASEGETTHTGSTTEDLPSADTAVVVTGVVTIAIAMEGPGEMCHDITSAVRGIVGILETRGERLNQAATKWIDQGTGTGLVNVTVLARVSAVESETVIVRETVMAHRLTVRGPHQGRRRSPFRNATDRVMSRTPAAAISETNSRRNATKWRYIVLAKSNNNISVSLSIYYLTSHHIHTYT